MILKEIIHPPGREEESGYGAERVKIKRRGKTMKTGKKGRNEEPHPVCSNNTSARSHCEILMGDW